MPHRHEARALPSGKERVNAVPAVERNAQAVRLHHAVNVDEGVEHGGRAVVPDGAA